MKAYRKSPVGTVTQITFDNFNLLGLNYVAKGDLRKEGQKLFDEQTCTEDTPNVLALATPGDYFIDYGTFFELVSPKVLHEHYNIIKE